MAKSLIISIYSLENIFKRLNMKIGYARVSTKHQRESLDQQIASLKTAGCNEVYSEVISGANSKRPELTKLLDKIEADNTLVITSVDRLGRSLKDLIGIISDLKERSVNFCSLKEQMDTGTDTGMLLFNMMGSIAEFERSLINRRIYEGVKRAKELGRYKGRVHSADKTIRGEYVKMMKTGNYPVSYIAKMAKVSRQTLYNWQAELSS
jgi:DNA invertase Pin-like site-specific DNA recombinase